MNDESEMTDEEFKRHEADRLRFMARPGSFTPTHTVNSATDERLYRVIFSLLVIVAYFSFFATGFGIAVHNFYLISAGAASSSNWVYALIGVLMVWISSAR